MNWLERARIEIGESPPRATAVSAERNLSAATAVDAPALLEISPAPFGSIGSEARARMPKFDEVFEDFEERAAIMEFDGGLSREEAEREAWALAFESALGMEQAS